MNLSPCPSYYSVRYDLEIVDDELKKRGFKLRKKENTDIWVENADAGLVSNLLQTGVTDYVLSKEERCNAIVVHILDSQTPVSIEQLADRLIVSRSTLVTEFKIMQ